MEAIAPVKRPLRGASGLWSEAKRLLRHTACARLPSRARWQNVRTVVRFLLMTGCSMGAEDRAASGPPETARPASDDPLAGRPLIPGEEARVALPAPDETVANSEDQSTDPGDIAMTRAIREAVVAEDTSRRRRRASSSRPGTRTSHCAASGGKSRHRSARRRPRGARRRQSHREPLMLERG